jgi:hypothetical protein
VLHNASNIVMVGTPQTEHTPLALGIVDSDSIEVFGVLATAMHLDFYGKAGPPALITVNSTTRTRIVCANVERSSHIVESNEPGMSVSSTGSDWSSAVIAWDTDVPKRVPAKTDDAERGKPAPSFWPAGWGFISHGGFPPLPASWTNGSNTKLSNSVVTYFVGNSTGMNNKAELEAQAKFGVVGLGWQLNQAPASDAAQLLLQASWCSTSWRRPKR